jgi:o-succinylbenzoate synthase
LTLTDFSLVPYSLPLRHPWRSAHGSITKREGWLVRLVADSGLVGYGDCAPLPMAGTESSSTALTMLEHWGLSLCGLPPDQALVELDRVAHAAPAARCGLETALIDLLAQQAGRPLARWLNPDAALEVRANAALGSLDDRAVERVLVAVAAGFSVLKLKVGLAAGQEEIPQLRDLAQALPPGIGLRLDANCAWDEMAAQRYLGELAGLPVESVEDPLHRPDPKAWHRLQTAVSYPLAADEALMMLGEQALFSAPAVRRVVLKPMVLGGLRPAWALARRARQAGVECVVTTTLDNAVGAAAARHLAAAVANDLAHGLATSSWLLRDVGESPPVIGGLVRLEKTPGLGCNPII